MYEYSKNLLSNISLNLNFFLHISEIILVALIKSSICTHLNDKLNLLSTHLV